MTYSEARLQAACQEAHSRQLSEARRGHLVEHESRPPDLVVVQALHPFTCARCGRPEGRADLLVMEDAGPVCLGCSSMDHLVFLRSGALCPFERVLLDEDPLALVALPCTAEAQHDGGEAAVMLGPAGERRVELAGNPPPSDERTVKKV